MPRPINTQIDVRVQVIDANSDPVTGATVQIKVLMPNGDDWDGSWNMIHLGDGVYASDFTPDSPGTWVAQCFSANPKFRKSFVYVVDVSGEWIQQAYFAQDIINPTVGDWVTVIDDNIGTQLQNFIAGQNNDEAASKLMRVELTMDNLVMEGYWNMPALNGGLAFGQALHAATGHNQAGFSSIDSDQGFGCFGWRNLDETTSQTDLGFKHFKVRVKLVSASGTNQLIRIEFLRKTKGTPAGGPI